ncbi:MAG TPA: OpgC domain-containing protein [Acetobacteraceae bacterium]|nr:OpgC domain-containing protein [Acetobacteraceae bacterium]
MSDATIAPAHVQGRDRRLDLARGLCLFVIMVDHMRLNNLGFWTFGQFGLSDAASVFLFVSGYTAAIAFGRTFERAGWPIGSARVLQRVWVLYVAQIAVVLAVAAIPGMLQHLFDAHGYVKVLGLDLMFHDPLEAFWGIVSLTYVPGHLDILPVYVVLLATVPAVVALARVDRRLVAIASLAVWLGAWFWHWNLLANPVSGRGWYFDPFGWQLLFFGAFMLGMGWVRLPAPSRALDIAAGVMLAFGVIVRVETIWSLTPVLGAMHEWTVAHLDKTHVGPLETLHFAALAWLATRLVDLVPGILSARAMRPFVICGQQSLPVFLGTIILADLGAVAFDQIGTGPAAQLGVNAVCFAILFGVGTLTRWIKSAPWKEVRAPVHAATAVAVARPAVGRRMSRPMSRF